MWRERRVEPVSTSTFTDDSGAILAMVVELTCTAAAAVAIVLAACDSWSQNKYRRTNEQLTASIQRRRGDPCHPIPSIARTVGGSTQVHNTPYHRTESSTKAAAAAQLLLVEYCNTQVSTLSSAECLIARAAPWGQRWVQSTHGRPRKHSLGYIHSPFR